MIFDATPPCQFLMPQWPSPRNIVACVTTRACEPTASASSGGRAGFNVGAHVGDDPQAVAQRRALVDAHFGMQAVYLNQVHGTQVQVLSRATAKAAIPDADASCTTAEGIACAIMVADCLPVLACNRAGTWVGAAHAGWRGLAQGVLEALVAAHQQAAKDEGGSGTAQASDLLFWLGPCIGPTAFEVGAEVRDAFVAASAHPAQVQACFAPAAESGKWLGNLPQLARLRLAEQGVSEVHGNDGSPPWCTVSNEALWFSYRRDQARLGSSGRMAAYIWRAPNAVR